MRRDPREPFINEFPTDEDWDEYRSYLDGEIPLERANGELQQIANELRDLRETSGEILRRGKGISLGMPQA